MHLLRQPDLTLRAELRAALVAVAEATERLELAHLRADCARVHLPWWKRLDIELLATPSPPTPGGS